MKILFVISSIGIGGEQRVASILTNEFVSKGHEVDIATFNIEQKSFNFNEYIQIKKIGGTTNIFKNILRILDIRRMVKKNQYDIVIGFAVIPSVLSSIALFNKKTPVIVCERNDPSIYKKLWKIIRNIAYRFSAGAIFQTSDAQKYFENIFYNNSTVIPNPVEVNQLPDSKDEIDKKSKRKRIVNTARLTKAKNQELLIKAFANIQSEFPEHNLAIYGDGPKRVDLLNLIGSLGLNNRVFLFEADPDVINEIKNDELFVLTSNNEGFPNSLAEAMAIGLPVISTNCRIGGPKDMIDNNINGILVEVNDEQELTNSIRKCLLNDEFRRKISKNAYSIKDELDANNISNQWINFFRTTLTKYKS